MKETIKKEILTTKAIGLSYLARAILDFKSFPILCNKTSSQIYSVVVHGVNKMNWNYAITEVYFEIEKLLCNGIQRKWNEKAGMVASLDFEGTRKGCLEEKLIEHPHVHALFILPAPSSLSARDLSWDLDDKASEIIASANQAMGNKGVLKPDQLGNSSWNFSIYVEPFHKKNNVCFTSAVSYQIKALSYLNGCDLISPIVYPFDLKMHKLQAKKSKIEVEKERAHQLRKELVFDPRQYFSGDLFEMDMQHQFFLTQYSKLVSFRESELLKIKEKAISHIENNRFDKIAEMATEIKKFTSSETHIDYI